LSGFKLYAKVAKKYDFESNLLFTRLIFNILDIRSLFGYRVKTNLSAPAVLPDMFAVPLRYRPVNNDLSRVNAFHKLFDLWL